MKMMTALDELGNLIDRHSKAAMTPTAIQGLTILHADRVSACAVPGVYVPMVCVIAQGAKQVVVGSTILRYDESHYLISSVDLPVSGRITRATERRPYLALGLDLDLTLLGSILATLPHGPNAQGTAPAITVLPQSPELLDCFVRLMRLLDRPVEITPLAPLILREIFYRLLTGSQGAMLRQIVFEQSRTTQVLRAIH